MTINTAEIEARLADMIANGVTVTATGDLEISDDLIATLAATESALKAGRHADRVAGVRKGASSAKEMVRRYGVAASNEVSLALMASLIRRIDAIDADAAAREISND